MRIVHGILLAFFLLFILGLILVLTGCATQPLTYEQQMAIRNAGAAISEASERFGEEARYRAAVDPYGHPQFYTPYQVHFEPLRIDPNKGY
jgi:hypothetical protein